MHRTPHAFTLLLISFLMVVQTTSAVQTQQDSIIIAVNQGNQLGSALVPDSALQDEPRNRRYFAHFSPTAPLAMIAGALIHGDRKNTFLWDMGFDIKVAPMLMAGVGVTLHNEYDYSHWVTIGPNFEVSTIRTDDKVFEAQIIRTQIEWYLSGNALDDSFVLGMQGLYRFINFSDAYSSQIGVSRASIRGMIGYRRFYNNGFSVSFFVAADTYSGTDPSKGSFLSTFNCGYAF